MAERLVAVRARMRELEHSQGFDLGLLDFPSERRGEEVLLCWQVGEDSVTSWHGVAEGYAGRKPIDWSE